MSKIRRTAGHRGAPSTRACNAAFTGTGCGRIRLSECPPFLWQWFCSASGGTLSAPHRWVPTICEVRVTSGIKPESRARGVSANFGRVCPPRSAAASKAGFSRLVKHSARHWATRIRLSALQLAFKGVMLLRTSRKWAAMLSSFRISSPVSCSVPANVATSASVAEVAVGGAHGNRRVTPSTPASTFSRAISAIGSGVTVRVQSAPQNVLISLTSSYAAIGVRMPDIS